MHDLTGKPHVGGSDGPSHQAEDVLFKESPTCAIEAWHKGILGVPRSGLPAMHELRAQTFALVRHFNNHPAALPVFVRSRSTPDREFESRSPASLRAIYDEGREHLKRVLSRAVESDLLRPISLELLTEFYLAVLQVSIHEELQRNRSMDVPACVDQILTCFLDGARWRY